MKLIDADALKLGIISQSNTGRESYSTDLICEFIDEQPEIDVRDINVGKWIPCSKRLPEESGTYIVNAIENGIIHVSFAKWMPRMRTWNLTGSRSYWKINSWMPLPEPYRPDLGEEE